MSVVFGTLIGFSLGLTGSGGSIFAVPLLVYGLSVAPRQAVVISLASVGATSLVGFLERLRSRQVEISTGLLFAIAGMLGAPVGSWLAGKISETLLLILFAILMLVVAARMWTMASQSSQSGQDQTRDRAACRRDPQGRLLLNSRCAALLAAVGLATGILAGLFGVGGGFIIVPALILFSGMNIQNAIATSLMIVTLVSVSGLASHLWAGRTIPTLITLLFIVGGVGGLLIATRLRNRLSGPSLQRIFAVAILIVAVFVVAQNVT